MLRFLYYKGYIEILPINELNKLQEDILNDYNNGTIEPHQYEMLTEKITSKFNTNKVVYI